MSDTKYRWYVLRAISGKEHKVKEYVDAEMATSDSILRQFVSQILVPTEKVYATRNGKRVIKERNYLPGYVLVECRQISECSARLRNVPNVLGWLGQKDNTLPSPIRPAEVNRILGKVDEVDNPSEDIAIPFLVGERVKVTEGSFKGLFATVEEVLEDKKKLRISVMIFGRKTPMEIGFAQVEKEG